MWSFSRESKLKYEVLKIVYFKPGTRELNFLFINVKKKIHIYRKKQNKQIPRAR